MEDDKLMQLKSVVKKETLFCAQENVVLRPMKRRFLVPGSYANQQAYYDSIAKSSRRGDSGTFIDFMLGEILRTLKAHQGEGLDDGGNVGTNVGENERKILFIIVHTPQTTAREMAELLGITLRQCERILASLNQKELIARVGANKGGHWKIVLD